MSETEQPDTAPQPPPSAPDRRLIYLAVAVIIVFGGMVILAALLMRPSHHVLPALPVAMALAALAVDWWVRHAGAAETDKDGKRSPCIPYVPSPVALGASVLLGVLVSVVYLFVKASNCVLFPPAGRGEAVSWEHGLSEPFGLVIVSAVLLAIVVVGLVRVCRSDP